jgi:hypothetical protein
MLIRRTDVEAKSQLERKGKENVLERRRRRNRGACIERRPRRDDFF